MGQAILLNWPSASQPQLFCRQRRYTEQNERSILSILSESSPESLQFLKIPNPERSPFSAKTSVFPLSGSQRNYCGLNQADACFDQVFSCETFDKSYLKDLCMGAMATGRVPSFNIYTA
jgi:hypothetical protein